MPYASLNSNYQRSICIGKRNDEQKSRQSGSSGRTDGRQVNLKEKKKKEKSGIRCEASPADTKQINKMLSPTFPLLRLAPKALLLTSISMAAKNLQKRTKQRFRHPVWNLGRELLAFPQPGSAFTPIVNFTMKRKSPPGPKSPLQTKEQVLPGELSGIPSAPELAFAPHFYAGSRPWSYISKTVWLFFSGANQPAPSPRPRKPHLQDTNNKKKGLGSIPFAGRTGVGRGGWEGHRLRKPVIGCFVPIDVRDWHERREIFYSKKSYSFPRQKAL